jgi:hypothetical protein
MSLDRMVAEHYARGDLGSAILAALESAGKDVDRLSLEDLAPVDEFHVRGRPATAELTGALGLTPGMRCSTWAAASAARPAMSPRRTTVRWSEST